VAYVGPDRHLAAVTSQGGDDRLADLAADGLAMTKDASRADSVEDARRAAAPNTSVRGCVIETMELSVGGVLTRAGIVIPPAAAGQGVFCFRQDLSRFG
jgi:hypothetical protein